MKTKTSKHLLIGILTFLLTSFTILQKEEIKDYLSFGNQITFNKETYNLKWSSNPSLNYYKQEYLRKEDQFPNYQKMMIIEAIKGNLTVAQAANSKITELENWKIGKREIQLSNTRNWRIKKRMKSLLILS